MNAPDRYGLRREMNSPRAFFALLGGAAGIGFAPVLVRLSEVGPSATAFYRMLFALPPLWIWLALERRKRFAASAPGAHIARPANYAGLALAGLFFTGDLAVWHWSLQYTSVANSTLLTNFAPLFVTAGAWMWFREHINKWFILGLVIAMAGAALLVGESVQFGRGHLFGDALAVVTAMFYAGYLLCLKTLRRAHSTATIMAISGLVSAAGLLLVAWLSSERLWPESVRGWAVVIGLALVSHLAGQTLIAYAFGHLPASLSSLNLLLQPVVAAAAAWLVLNERLTGWQAIGASIVLAGIFLGNWFRR